MKLLLEEFGIKTTHVKGLNNVVADPMSRLDFVSDGEEETTGCVDTGPHPHFPEVLCMEILNLEEEEFLLDLAFINRY